MKLLTQLVLMVGLLSTFSCTKEKPVEKKIRATLLSVTLTEAQDYSPGSNPYADPHFVLIDGEKKTVYSGEYYQSKKLPVTWDNLDVLLNDPIYAYQFTFSDLEQSRDRPFAIGYLTLEDVYPETEVEIIHGSGKFSLQLFYR